MFDDLSNVVPNGPVNNRSRAYNKKGGPMIVFPGDPAEPPERVVARSLRELSVEELEILADCLTVRHD